MSPRCWGNTTCWRLPQFFYNLDFIWIKKPEIPWFSFIHFVLPILHTASRFLLLLDLWPFRYSSRGILVPGHELFKKETVAMWLAKLRKGTEKLPRPPISWLLWCWGKSWMLCLWLLLFWSLWAYCFCVTRGRWDLLNFVSVRSVLGALLAPPCPQGFGRRCSSATQSSSFSKAGITVLICIAWRRERGYRQVYSTGWQYSQIRSASEHAKRGRTVDIGVGTLVIGAETIGFDHSNHHKSN